MSKEVKEVIVNRKSSSSSGYNRESPVSSPSKQPPQSPNAKTIKADVGINYDPGTGKQSRQNYHHPAYKIAVQMYSNQEAFGTNEPQRDAFTLGQINKRFAELSEEQQNKIINKTFVELQTLHGQNPDVGAIATVCLVLPAQVITINLGGNNAYLFKKEKNATFEGCIRLNKENVPQDSWGLGHAENEKDCFPDFRRTTEIERKTIDFSDGQPIYLIMGTKGLLEKNTDNNRNKDVEFIQNKLVDLTGRPTNVGRIAAELAEDLSDQSNLTCIVHELQQNQTDGYLIGVFDGDNGAEVAQQISKNILNIFRKHLDDQLNEIDRAKEKTSVEVMHALRNKNRIIDVDVLEGKKLPDVLSDALQLKHTEIEKVKLEIGNRLPRAFDTLKKVIKNLESETVNSDPRNQKFNFFLRLGETINELNSIQSEVLKMNPSQFVTDEDPDVEEELLKTLFTYKNFMNDPLSSSAQKKLSNYKNAYQNLASLLFKKIVRNSNSHQKTSNYYEALYHLGVQDFIEYNSNPDDKTLRVSRFLLLLTNEDIKSSSCEKALRYIADDKHGELEKRIQELLPTDDGGKLKKSIIDRIAEIKAEKPLVERVSGSVKKITSTLSQNSGNGGDSRSNGQSSRDSLYNIADPNTYFKNEPIRGSNRWFSFLRSDGHRRTFRETYYTSKTADAARYALSAINNRIKDVDGSEKGLKANKIKLLCGKGSNAIDNILPRDILRRIEYSLANNELKDVLDSKETFTLIAKNFYDKIVPIEFEIVLKEIKTETKNKARLKLQTDVNRLLSIVNQFIINVNQLNDSKKKEELQDTISLLPDYIAYQLFAYSQEIPWGFRNGSKLYKALMEKIANTVGIQTKDGDKARDIHEIRKDVEDFMRNKTQHVIIQKKAEIFSNVLNSQKFENVVVPVAEGLAKRSQNSH